MPVELTEALLSAAAGWEVMKRARAYLEQGEVLSSYWAPPLLRGVVQAGESYFSRLHGDQETTIDIENLCTCREAREWGKICAHGVAVGTALVEGAKATSSTAGGPPGSRRAPARIAGEKAPTLRALPPANRRNCSLSCRRISTRPSRAAKSCWCWRRNGAAAGVR